MTNDFPKLTEEQYQRVDAVLQMHKIYLEDDMFDWLISQIESHWAMWIDEKKFDNDGTSGNQIIKEIDDLTYILEPVP